ncbi:HPt (histidine-containing phosphotransfer) domain-containing protein [Pseudarthrobacter oxydans]|uniref:Hpt domain-containing protein n=1 Tax=Pseudarthrobacter oxydans TaxID=1671 RepID=UPI0027866562|nr:Hpt domain-containing protein [Pseudarthrobacter oxydans]MDP9982098.1 HPt (histidine-containing phosphotransfer) domain-containing protein [Pseudarthrobacter oxydans]
MSFQGAPDDGDATIGLSADASPGGAGLAPAGAKDTGPDMTPPLVDPTALQELGSQLESPAVARGFARDYTNMWNRRYQSLASSLGSGDEAAALDAVLSLKTSSAMVGGVRLAGLARELEDAIRVRDANRARLLLQEVAESGNETVDELQFSYLKDS